MLCECRHVNGICMICLCMFCFINVCVSRLMWDQTCLEEPLQPKMWKQQTDMRYVMWGQVQLPLHFTSPTPLTFPSSTSLTIFKQHHWSSTCILKMKPGPWVPTVCLKSLLYVRNSFAFRRRADLLLPTPDCEFLDERPLLLGLELNEIGGRTGGGDSSAVV